MELKETTSRRKSIRKFKNKPVLKNVIENVLEVAAQSPSALNTQPWEVYAVSGRPLEMIKQGNIELLTTGTMPSPESQSMENLAGVYKKRQVDLAVELFKLMEIGREDSEKRFDWMQRGFRFFDAPAAIIMVFDKALDNSANTFSDLGSFLQTFCLAALEHDLGTCIHSQGVMYPQVVRKHIDIPDEKKIFIAVSIGYPDWDFPANRIESAREPVENITRWFGFE